MWNLYIISQTKNPTNVGLDAMLIFHFSSLEESSLCIVEPEAAPNDIPKAIPSPTLSITAPRIIPKTTPCHGPNFIYHPFYARGKP